MTTHQSAQIWDLSHLINELELDGIAANFPANCASFPCNYLGLPLHIGRTRRVDEQLLIDKIGARLPGWKGRLLTRAGRLTLINSVLTSIPVYHMTVFHLSKWAIKRIDRIRRNFLWTGANDIRHGSCLVNWRQVNRAKKLGGLGIKDLKNVEYSILRHLEHLEVMLPPSIWQQGITCRSVGSSNFAWRRSLPAYRHAHASPVV